MMQPSEWPDAELIQRVLDKDPRGWPEMLRRFGQLIRYSLGKYAKDLSSDDHDEVYHDVVLKLLCNDMQELRKYDASRSKLSTYIALHTRWMAGKFRRRAARDPLLGAEDDATIETESDTADAATALDDVIDRDQREKLDRFALTLKPRDRRFFDLHYRQGLPRERVASILDRTKQAISLQNQRVTAQLRAAFENVGAPIPIASKPAPTRCEVVSLQSIAGWQPREYEIRAVQELRRRLPVHRRVLAVGPTGCGKTVIASMLIGLESTWRVLFVVHRYELADQAYRALSHGGIRTGIVMAQDEAMHGVERADPEARVQVASVQTLLRREAPRDVNLIIFDEAHRVMADSYQAVASAHPAAMVCGLTATPERDDGKGLGDFFRDMYVIARPSELQRDGHLALPRWFGARADVVAQLTERLRGTRVSNGDYAPRDLARAVDSRRLLGEVASEAVRIAPKVSKVVFAGGVEHSQRLAAKFNQHGIATAHLDGETPAKEREAMLAALAQGALEIICNYDVLSEGWDMPDLGAVVLARPFRSRKKYLQVVGRGMRWRRGARPIVIDHGNNAPRFGIWPGDDVDWSLASTTARRGEPLWKQCEGCQEKIPLATTVCPGCGFECPIERARLEHEEQEAKLEEATRAQYLALRSRVEAMAAKKGVSPAWVESVMESAR